MNFSDLTFDLRHQNGIIAQLSFIPLTFQSLHSGSQQGIGFEHRLPQLR
jgi:hypothetical protein